MKPEDLIKQQPKEYSTIYVDMNSFFASVEQFYDPKLRGRPVAVATALSGGGSIIAASVEAKRFGIKTGAKVAEARLKCPEIVVIRDNPDKYRLIHREIMTILHSTPCYVCPKSIDEAYLKVPSYMRTRKQTLALSKEIKAILFDRYNEYILCSIGVASNIWLAKMGSNSRKPNGLVVYTKSTHRELYASLRLIDFTGISWRLARRMYATGIDSPMALYNASWRFLSSKFGVNGTKWYLRMRGVEVDFQPAKVNKSISHQITTIPRVPSSNVEITTYLIKISIALGVRLRHKSLIGRGISLTIHYLDGQKWTNTYQHTTNYRSDYEIIALSKMLLKKQKNFEEPVRMIVMTLFNLEKQAQTAMPIDSQCNKILTLTNTIDDINAKFGQNSIKLGESLGLESINLNRIGFGTDLVREKYY